MVLHCENLGVGNGESVTGGALVTLSEAESCRLQIAVGEMQAHAAAFGDALSLCKIGAGKIEAIGGAVQSDAGEETEREVILAARFP